MGTVARGLWSGYWAQMIEDIKSCKPEVEASQPDKRLQSYGWLTICYLKTQIYIFQAQKSLKFSGGDPHTSTPVPHLPTGIYDCTGQLYTDTSAYRPCRYRLLQIILKTLHLIPLGRGTLKKSIH